MARAREPDCGLQVLSLPLTGFVNTRRTPYSVSFFPVCTRGDGSPNLMGLLEVILIS